MALNRAVEMICRTLPRMTLVALVAAAELSSAPTASAYVDGQPALNGRYLATSDGEFAKTNDRFHDETTISSTWTIASTCTTYLDCTGHVNSDQGWSADILYKSDMWYLTRTLQNWEQCADGTTAPGTQTFKFYADRITPNLLGWDKTVGPSGACGINKPLVISLPFKLVPLA